MSDASSSMPDSTSPGFEHFGSPSKTRLMLRAVLYFSLLVSLAVVGYAIVRAAQDQAALKDREGHLLAGYGLIQPSRKHLAPEYTDKTGRLMADPPRNPARQLDPETLVLAYYKDADAEMQMVDWEAFRAHLAEATGKEVVAQEYNNSTGDVAAIKSGQIHVVAMHSADTPYAVNNAGFIPIAVLGSEAGAHGNRLDIAVAAKSDIKKLEDLRGHMLTCTAPDSMTGYRAAIVLLSQEAGLRPDRDYSINFSLGQKRSVLGLIQGDFEVAALSDDKVQSMLEKGTLKASDYRVIYQSPVLPRLTIGYVYNLKPALAEKLAAAALHFENARGPADESTGKPMRFFAIDYARDFDLVRRIDDSFDPRFRKSLNADPAPPADNPTQD